jgi:hypothetical protein
MGNDGGSIPTRRELVKHKKKEEKKENYEDAKNKAKLCNLSKEQLREPISVCRLGRLYNKEEIIRRLIEKTMPSQFRHIKKLKDVKEAKLVMKEDPDGSNTIICPLSGIEFNGFNKFLMVWDCGCVISEESALELKLSSTCVSCGTPISKKTDIITLNQSKEEE